MFKLNYYTINILYGLLLLYLAHVCQVCRASHSSLYVDNGGYKGLVVAINKDIPVSESTELLDRLQTLIKETSKALFNATGLYFAEVTIKVPNTWTQYTNKIAIRDSDADVIVIDRESEQSFTMQWGGCGSHALPIVLTKKTVRDDGYGPKLLVHEWAHYRYGVFNEFGYSGDPVYPSYYSIVGNPNVSDILVNSCADKEFSYKTETQMGSPCTLSTSNTTGLPIDSKCTALPKDDSQFESSLMYAHSIKSANKFCGDTRTGQGLHRHNTQSPNKQNNLCDGKDVWTVISAHPDHTNSKKLAEDIETKITVVMESDTRTLFVIQNVKSMHNPTPNPQINLINFALNKYKLDYPQSTVALSIYNRVAYSDSIDPMFKWTTGSVNFSPTSIKNTTSMNFEKLLREGLNLFHDQPTSSGTFVAIIATKIDSTNTVEKVKVLSMSLRDSHIKLNIIVFPFDSNDERKFASDIFLTAASVTGGQVYYVGKDLPASTFSRALANIDSSYHIIGEKTFDSSTTHLDFEFNLDKSLMHSQLRVYFMASSPIGYPLLESIELKDPTGFILDQANYQDQSMSILGFNVPIDSYDKVSQSWHLSVTRKTTSSDVSFVAIAEFDKQSLDDSPITGQCWLNTVNYNPKTDGNKPVMAYVNLRGKLDQLVSDVSVKLVVNDQMGGPPKSIDMFDDGFGDPDITAGDGIYSTYITNIETQGYFTISVEIGNTKDTDIKVTKNFGSTSLSHSSDAKTCCGSRVNGQPVDGLSLTKLSRRIECGTLFVSDTQFTNEYPPNSVRNLQVERVGYGNRTISLKWSSPGGDYTSGFVNKYDIRAFLRRDNHEDDDKLLADIRTNFENAGNEDIDFKPDSMADGYGKEERCDVTIKSDAGGVYYLALKAFDSDNRGSVVSNIVMAYIKSNVIIQSTTAYADVSSVPGNGDPNDGLLAGMTWWEILLIAIGGAVVLIIIGIFFICCICKRRRKSSDSTDTEVKREVPVPARRAPEPPRVSPELEKSPSILLDDTTSFTRSVEKIPNIHINSLQQNNAYNTGSQQQIHPQMHLQHPQHIHQNGSYNSGSQQNLRELSVSALSPVQSWDANILLNHWGRVQEAKQRQERPPVMRIEDLESGSSNHSPSYASSDDDNNIYTNPMNVWQYNDINGRPTYAIPHSYNEPIYRSTLDHPMMRSDTPSDTVPRYSTIIRKPTQNVSQV